MSTNSYPKCVFCGQHHGPLCPVVKAVEYYPNGTLKRVEFKTAQDYCTQPDYSDVKYPYISYVHF